MTRVMTFCCSRHQLRPYVGGVTGARHVAEIRCLNPGGDGQTVLTRRRW